MSELAPKKKKMIKVHVKASPATGFRRAGKYWPNGGIETEVDEETFAILKAEPKLLVTERDLRPVSLGASEKEELEQLRATVEKLRADRRDVEDELETVRDQNKALRADRDGAVAENEKLKAQVAAAAPRGKADDAPSEPATAPNAPPDGQEPPAPPPSPKAAKAPRGKADEK